LFGQGGPEEDDIGHGENPSSNYYGQAKDDSEDDEKKLSSFSKKVSKLSLAELDRDLAETRIDIDFLESQIKADFGSYSPQDLQRARTRILFSKRKAEIVEKELAKKNKLLKG